MFFWGEGAILSSLYQSNQQGVLSSGGKHCHIWTGHMQEVTKERKHPKVHANNSLACKKAKKPQNPNKQTLTTRNVYATNQSSNQSPLSSDTNWKSEIRKGPNTNSGSSSIGKHHKDA